MYFALDNKPLIRRPVSIEVLPQSHEASLTADGRPLVFPAGNYVEVDATWGRDVLHEDVLAELEKRQANRGVHSITFAERTYPGCPQRYTTLNAYMGKPRLSMVGQTVRGKLAYSSFTIPFLQVDPPTQLFPILLNVMGLVSVVSPAASHVAPAAGRIVAIDGWIRDVGSGAGQTRIQISNGSTNYLSTAGDFLQGGDHTLVNAVLGADLDFAEGDQLDLDVTAIPAGGLSKDVRVCLWTLLFRP